MYSYEWDAETGGILLNSTPLQMSKEPRPVYYKELDILGFDKYWKYDKDDKYPYMWAEANNYFYKGRLVAKIKGGTMCTAPEIVILDNPEPNDEKLKFVDVKKDNPVLGTIAYPSNKNSLPQSIRFGMRANQQNGLTSKTQFIGTGHFKFKRIALNGGNNP